MKNLLNPTHQDEPYCEVHYFGVTAVGNDQYRVILKIFANSPASQSGKLIKRYEVWANIEAIADKLSISEKNIDQKMIEQFAVDALRGRYMDSNGVPDENGVYFSDAHNMHLGDPETFRIMPPPLGGKQ